MPSLFLTEFFRNCIYMAKVCLQFTCCVVARCEAEVEQEKSLEVYLFCFVLLLLKELCYKKSCSGPKTVLLIYVGSEKMCCHRNDLLDA